MSIEPYYSDDFVTLYHADCRKIDAWLAADVLATDPPYGRDWKQGTLKAARNHPRSNGRQGIANDQTTAVRDQVLAKWGTKPAVVFGDLMLAPPAGTKQVCVFRKPADAGMRGAIAGRRRDLEAIYLVGSWPSGLGGASSLFATNAPVQGSPHGAAARYGHPHAKPVDVMAELIGMSTGVVADPFAGSGSTLVAARLLGRKAVGVEIGEAYCERAAERLSMPDLFGGAA